MNNGITYNLASLLYLYSFYKNNGSYHDNSYPDRHPHPPHNPFINPGLVLVLSFSVPHMFHNAHYFYLDLSDEQFKYIPSFTPFYLDLPSRQNCQCFESQLFEIFEPLNHQQLPICLTPTGTRKKKLVVSLTPTALLCLPVTQNCIIYRSVPPHPCQSNVSTSRVALLLSKSNAQAHPSDA